MMYVQVPVPEEHVPAVLEFVLSRVRSTTPAEAPPETRINPAMNDDVDDRLYELVSAVNDDARVLLEAVAQVPDTRMNMEKLTEVSGVGNVGAALQSLKIQRTRLDVASPIEKRRNSQEDGRYVYWMSAPTAARILRIMEGDR
jgi:hypothetical protein